MKRDERQILINPHSSQEKVPVGVLNLGEIGVQHNNVEDAALYVETDANSESAETVAKFISEKAIDTRIEAAMDELQIEIDGINEAVGLPHDPELWNSGMSVWDAIEHTYQEMTAGTAAANTKLELVGGEDEYLALTSEKDEATSSITYYLKSQNIDERVESAYTIVNNNLTVLSGAVEELSAATEDEIERLDEKVDELSAATEDEIERLDDKVDELSAATEDAIAELEEQLEEIEAEINANEVSSEDGSIIVMPTTAGTDLSVNIDNASIVQNDNNELVADLKLTAVTPSNPNVREEFALVNHNGTQLGATVKVYKDSALYDVFLGHTDDELSDPDDPQSVVTGSGDTALCFIYHKEDGTYELVAVDVNEFLEESEFKDGFEVNNHVVKVKIDDASEEVTIASGVTAPVLSVSENGVKVDNIQAAIDYAVETLAHNVDADVEGEDAEGHVKVEVVQVDTALEEVVVTTNDIASEEELKTVEESIGLGENGEFEPIPGNFTESATSVIEAIESLDDVLKEVSDKLDAAEVFETGSTENWVTISVEEVENGKTGITLDDSALADELIDMRAAMEAETLAREMAYEELLGNSASTSAETSIMGLKELISEITVTLVKDVTVNTGETLIEVAKEDTPEGDLYTISSSDRLNNAVELAEASVQEVAFAAVSDKDDTAYGSNVGAEVVPADGGEGSMLKLDLSQIKIDCGEY